ncbi:putative ribosomal RNA small subunit methyltransferase A [Candidatus Tiddalikarchaeum anstoanum]|nr:putative ribosomal RNA small subunit methyltransferase A [Candidatus Tiddalikarchaeum anstoanum]
MSIISFLKSRGISPDVWLDQCFLSDEKIIEAFVKVAKVKPDDTVLEIGPGTGLLTKKIAKRVKKVVCVEKDYRLYELLNSLFINSNVEVVHDDIIKYGLKDFRIIVSSLPYSIVDWFFKQLLMHDFEKAVVIISSKTFKKMRDESLLNSYLVFEKIMDVPKEAFYPTPSIDSVLVVVMMKDSKKLSEKESRIRRFYEKNSSKKVMAFIKDINVREGNKKISDLSGKEIEKIISLKE